MVDAARALRRFRERPAGRWLLSHVGALAMRLAHATTRWTVVGAANRAAVVDTGGAFIAAFWHGRLFFSPFWVPRGRRTLAVISNNHDGALISDTVAHFGVEAVRGSTAHPGKRFRDKGGRLAFAAALSALESGAVVGITPDGPRGPRMHAQPGVAALSVAAQVPVLPVAFATCRGRLLRGWDRFLVPMPFDRGVLVYGSPLAPPPRGDEAAAEAHRQAIEAALNAVTAEADRLAGRTPVAPA